jgi:hypothetical protein
VLSALIAPPFFLLLMTPSTYYNYHILRRCILTRVMSGPKGV